LESFAPKVVHPIVREIDNLGVRIEGRILAGLGVRVTCVKSLRLCLHGVYPQNRVEGRIAQDPGASSFRSFRFFELPT
jgi:hypothetical protein